MPPKYSAEEASHPGRPSEATTRYSSLHHAAFTWPSEVNFVARAEHKDAVDCVQVLQLIVSIAAAQSGVGVLKEQSPSVFVTHSDGAHEPSASQEAEEKAANAPPGRKNRHNNVRSMVACRIGNSEFNMLKLKWLRRNPEFILKWGGV